MSAEETTVGLGRSLLGKRLLRRYKLSSCLARGGMAIVFRAEDERLQRAVAVKVFSWLDPSETGYRASYEHFVQEAFALSQLQHPHTLRIFDFGYLEEEPKSPFQVSEFVPGGTLRALIKQRGPLPFDVAMEIVEALAGSLGEAHARGITHRDLKPSNVLIQDLEAPRPLCKLGDWGIAKARMVELPNAAGDTHHEGVLMYSPGWAAPEQYLETTVGPEADVFSLGLVVIYMLTGQRLVADSRVFRELSCHGDPDAYLDAAFSTLPLGHELQAVLRQACASDPTQRMPSVAALYDALRACRNDTAWDDRSTDANFQRWPLLNEPSGYEPPVYEPPVYEPATEAISSEPASGSSVSGVSSQAITRTVRAAPTLDVASGPTRLRLTLVPGHDGGLQLHVKGLNCFLSHEGSRVTRAIDVKSQLLLSLVTPERKVLDLVRCSVLPENDAASLDFGPGRELVIVQRGAGR